MWASRFSKTMLEEHKDRITVLRQRQFDAEPANVALVDGGLTQITITNLETKQPESYSGKVFIDATYEGDLASRRRRRFPNRAGGAERVR